MEGLGRLRRHRHQHPGQKQHSQQPRHRSKTERLSRGGGGPAHNHAVGPAHAHSPPLQPSCRTPQDPAVSKHPSEKAAAGPIRRAPDKAGERAARKPATAPEERDDDIPHPSPAQNPAVTGPDREPSPVPSLSVAWPRFCTHENGVSSLHPDGSAPTHRT
ncbi:hypothetical protein GCM10027456_71110 [Kineosporia babensis]